MSIKRIKDAVAPYLLWIKLGAFLAVVVASFIAGAWVSGLKCSVDSLTKENKALSDMAEDLRQAQSERDRLAKHLAEALNRPKAAPVIREVVRNAPSNCNLSKPVADSLREQIARANEAAR